jgi:NADPH-dependent glutamate synthase beta subunit-like oxidoreductase/NAD-dependent dihydropyrimidine dehydrogenase PreA subunit
MKEKKFPIEIPDFDFWKKQINCQHACPVHTDARGYVRAIAAEQFELAYLIARGPNPLASICGSVCGAPCEAACRRGHYDQPIAIRALKRFVCERFGPEARQNIREDLIEFLRKASQRYAPRQCQGGEELLPFLQSLTSARIPPVNGKRVGIIGSGPAGLAAAHDLALLGFAVTIYEMEPVLGGMLTVGIPEYRLPRDLVRAEVEVILSLGVKAVTNCFVGRDISFPELRKRHDAVVVAVGAKRSRKPLIPGSDAQGVFGGIEFLREVSLANSPQLGPRVVVIGGGDAAMDSARTALRVGIEDDEGDQWEQYLVIDTARTAMRLRGREINIVYRRSREEMPANQAEIYEAEEEGIRFHLLTAPVNIEKNERGGIRGIWCQKMKLGQTDSSGRKRPIPIEGSDYFMACDTVIIAIGQSFDLSFIGAECDDLQMTDREHIACDPETGNTSAPDIFVAGDLAHGPKLIIHAVASGKRVARTVYEKLTAHQITAEDMELHFPLSSYARELGYEKQPRLAPRSMPVNERLTNLNRSVEQGYTTKQALCEAGRCFDCGINTIFDSEKCIFCGGCEDVCPENCLKLVFIESLQGDPDFKQFMKNYFGDMPISQGGAIIKDETICIRCGLCAKRCPVGAITMEAFNYKEIFTGVRADPLVLEDRGKN